MSETQKFLVDSQLKSTEKRRLNIARELGNQLDLDVEITFRDGETKFFSDDEVLGINRQVLEFSTWTTKIYAEMAEYLADDSDKFKWFQANYKHLEQINQQLDAHGITHFEDNSTSKLQEKKFDSLREELKTISKGDLIRWNGRKNYLPVTENHASHFIVTGTRGGKYKFVKDENQDPHMVNLNSENTYSIKDFEIQGDNSADEDAENNDEEE